MVLHFEIEKEIHMLGLLEFKSATQEYVPIQGIGELENNKVYFLYFREKPDTVKPFWRFKKYRICRKNVSLPPAEATVPPLPEKRSSLETISQFLLVSYELTPV